MGTWEQIDAERTAFADLTDQLTPEQWDTLSLCPAWKVRDVVGHVNQGADLTTGEAIRKVTRYGFRVNTMLEKEARKLGARPSDELRADMRASVGKRRTPPGTKPEDVLNDLVVHQQDVRRPLGLPRTVPPETLRVLLDHVAGTKTFVQGQKRAKGISLRASDLDWRHGDGPEVTGTGEAILMALTGRADALKDLSGPGVDTLGGRIDG